MRNGLGTVVAVLVSALVVAGCSGGGTGLEVPNLATGLPSPASQGATAPTPDTDQPPTISGDENLVELSDGTRVAQKDDGSFRVLDDGADTVDSGEVPSPTGEGYVMPGPAINAKQQMSTLGVSYPSVGFPAQGAVDTAVSVMQAFHSREVLTDYRVTSSVKNANVSSHFTPAAYSRLVSLDGQTPNAELLFDSSNKRSMFWWTVPGSACHTPLPRCGISLTGSGYQISGLRMVDKQTATFKISTNLLWTVPDLPVKFSMFSQESESAVSSYRFTTIGNVRATYEEGRWLIEDFSGFEKFAK